MTEEAGTYSIETEVTEAYVDNLLEFIDHKYISPDQKRFKNVSRESVNGYPLLSFTTLNLSGEPELKITIKGTRPVEVDVTRLSETVAQERIDQIKQDIFIVVQHFEEHTRESTLYFAWREGEELIPEKITGKENKALNRLFLETQIFLAIVFISLSIVLFMFLGIYAPILLISLQLIIVFHSNKIIARAGDWEITSANPKIHLIQYHLPTEEYEEFKKKYSRKELIQIKKEVYEQTLSDGRKIDCETAQKIFSKHGFQCREENMLAKTVNVYELVKKTAGKFRLPMPKVVVSNTMIPNAAASGPSPKRGLILITTGLLVQLEEDEVLSVLGHEFSHLKSRDPLILFGLTALEFLLRFYVILPFFPIIFSSYVFFFLYFWAVMAIIYFIAKFFEAKSDLVSAMIIGKPKSMAEALEKIGFRRLQYERSPAYRLQRWIGLEPHPPVTFRVNRLKKLEVPVQIKHPLLQSIQDVTRGLLSNF